MISEKKVSIFKKYQGDPDAWARIATSEEKNVMSDEDWYLINQLIQDVVIARRNLDNRLRKYTDSDAVRNEIIDIANETLSQGRSRDGGTS